MGQEQRLLQVRGLLQGCGPGTVLRSPLHIENPQCVTIGANVSLNPFIHMWGGGGIEIGDRTMIASHVAITSLTHDPDSPAMYTSMIAKPIRIANDVWIGTHAAIMPGVTIGEHAVVAAGSIVLEDVPAYAVVAGVPAKIVRMKNRGEARAPGVGVTS